MRPTKERHVEQLPPVSQYKPVGVPLYSVDEIVVTVEEMEAIRLADVEGLDQEPASVSMGISRPTFHRILARAHTKIGKAIWEGKSFRIDGGTYKVGCRGGGQRRFRCGKCEHEWSVPHGQQGRGCSIPCPACSAQEALRLE